MHGYPTLKCLCAVLCIMIVVAEVASAAPTYADYEADRIRDFYEMLMQKEALEDRLGAHQVSRKSNRSPSLRLRFGRRSDPSFLPVSSSYLLTAQDSLERGEN